MNNSLHFPYHLFFLGAGTLWRPDVRMPGMMTPPGGAFPPRRFPGMFPPGFVNRNIARQNGKTTISISYHYINSKYTPAMSC